MSVMVANCMLFYKHMKIRNQARWCWAVSDL